MAKTILYFTDKLGISDGYMPIFNRLLTSCGIPIHKVQQYSIHTVIDKALKRRGNELELVVNPEKHTEINRLVKHQVATFKPDLIVCSCTGVLGTLNGYTWGADKISKTRGSVYTYNGIPSIIVPAISSIHRQQKAKDIDGGASLDGDTYRIKDGHWLLARDWSKVGRYYNDKTRKFPDFQYSIVRNILELQVVENWLKECVLISSDIETTGCHEAGGHTISCVGYTGLHRNGNMRTFVIPFADKFQSDGTYWNDEHDMMLAFQTMQRINATMIPKAYQSGAYDSAYNITWGCPQNGYILDAMHMWHSLYPELDKSLDVISSVLLDQYAYWKQDIKGLKEDTSGRRDTSMERFWRYNALDCHYTMCSTLLLLRLVLGHEKIKFNYANEFPQMLAGLVMTMRGLKANLTRREELRAELQQDYDEGIDRFRRLIDDPEFNINSAPQKIELMYDLLGATPRNKMGKVIRGRPARGKSAGKNALKMIATEHPFFKIIIDSMDDAQSPLKQISNVCDMRVLNERVRSSINVRTETWRYSSSSSPFWDGTNMQNIRKSMRDWMEADENCILFDVDYAQSDAVFVAHEANDHAYIKTMTSGKDSHAIHAEFFFHIPYDKIVQGVIDNDPHIVHPIKGIRNITKRIVHGANFQMAGMTLLVNMGKESVVATAEYLGNPKAGTWTEDQLGQFCQKLLNNFRGLYPRLSKRGWYGEIAAQLVRERQITNAFGMTRTFIGSPQDFGTQREATAFYGQSDTAGNMNRSIEEILFGYIPPVFRDGANPHAHERPLRLDHTDYGIETCLQVHDSFVGQINTTAPRWKEGLANILTVMQRPVIINGHHVTVQTDTSIGKRWGKDMIPWKSGDPYDLDVVLS